MVNMHGPIVRRVLFPLQESAKRHSTLAVCRDLERTQWLSTEALHELQVSKLRLFLERVGSTVPYYRSLFESLGFKPGSVRDLSALSALPLLDKATIREHTHQMVAVGAQGRLAQCSTGGSSGEPLTFFLGRDRVSHDVAAKRRATRWWGVDIGDPEVVIWGSPIELGAQDRLRVLRDRLFRTRLLSAFELSEQRLATILADIRSLRPRMLFGYPSAIAKIAEFAVANAQPMDDLGIDVAFTTSERLYDHQREIIQRVFACPVANGYGGRDSGFIAHECPEGTLHITSEDIVVEIVDEAGVPLPRGETGEIVVTHLHTAEFPFLRYRTGDVGALGTSDCACGRGLPVLEKLEGRATDFVTAADGTVMHGLALIYILREQPGIAEFRIIQEDLERTRVQVVPESDSIEIDAEGICKLFRQRLGDNVNVTIEYLGSIPRENSGKFRYVVSKLA